MWGHDHVVLCLNRCWSNASLHNDDYALCDWRVVMGMCKYSSPKWMQGADQPITLAPVAVVEEKDIVDVDHDPQYLLKGWTKP